MNHEDQTRFTANVEWFNGFFADIRQLYGLVVEMMPTDFFPAGFALAAGNFYFPKQHFAPTIPPYYVLMVRGERVALQIVAVLDPSLFVRSDPFVAEPSIVVVLHSESDRYGFIEDYALRVIGNRGIDIERHDGGRFWGKINAKLPANFFSFQVPLDRFSAERDPREAVREHIVDPITEELDNHLVSDRVPTTS